MTKHWTSKELAEFFVDYEFPCLADSRDGSYRKEEQGFRLPCKSPDTYSPRTKPETLDNSDKEQTPHGAIQRDKIEDNLLSVVKTDGGGGATTENSQSRHYFPFGTFCRRAEKSGYCEFVCTYCEGRR